ncbi:hypothetical protein BCU90_17405 [Vibrio lentus]|uniref:hypothetical protein n=1 Tax=Vibrio lentus TaxID=136468 RepID=UPI000C83E78F|nr:hypothetical protein [Vibrio lentus]PMG45641.1 hypothetical protein BCU90_17405 [Vibrio lentus]
MNQDLDFSNVSDKELNDKYKEVLSIITPYLPIFIEKKKREQLQKLPYSKDKESDAGVYQYLKGLQTENQWNQEDTYTTDMEK